MSFLEPLFLLGLLAGGVPLLVHLINRQKAVRRPFPALKLLQKSNQKVARSIKVRQWILLLLRVLAVVFLALALAKPYVLSSRGITAEERMPTAVVFVVDTGFSMAHGDWWPRAKRSLDEQIGRLRPWDEVAVVSTTSSQAVLARLTSDHAEARRAVANLTTAQRPGEIDRGLMAAADILSTSQLPNRRIVVISDFSRGSLADGTQPELALGYAIEQVSVRQRGEDSVTNLAMIGVEYEQEGTPQERTWKIDASVRNLSEHDASQVELRLKVGGQLVATDVVDVAAGKSVTSTFRHRIEAAGAQKCVVEIVGADALAEDDTWHFTIHPRERVRALLVNGQPSTIAQDDELFFLMRALSPGPSSESPIVPTVTTVDGLENRELAGFDVVVLANVARLAPASLPRLAKFVEDGGGLFITLGEQADPAIYNQQFGELLPRPLRGLKQLAERSDPDAPVKTTRFGHARRDHPVFRVFSLPGGGSIQSVQVFSYMLLEPSPADEQSSVLLSYQDNAPALLERRVGQGRVVMMTTSVDREWTDFPIRTAYLPLMRRTMMYLARRSASRGEAKHIVGGRVRLEVAGLVHERVIAHTPSGGRLVLEPVEGEVAFVAEEAGFYEFWADDDESGAERNRIDQLTLGVNVDVRGSDLRPLPANALEPWISAEAHAAAASAQPHANQRRVNLWSKFLFLITLVLLAETILGTRRSVLAKIGRRLLFRPEPGAEA